MNGKAQICNAEDFEDVPECHFTETYAYFTCKKLNNRVYERLETKD